MTSAQIALVTGANRGIGLEVSRQLSELGYQVIMAGRDQKKTQAAAEQIPNSTAIVLDVASAESVHAAASTVAAQFDRIDVLVNNAAINYDTWQRAENADLDNVMETFQTNLFGVWRTTQAFLPLIRKSSHGRIVNVSSESGSVSDIDDSAPGYAASKAALNALTGMLAADLRDTGILVNAVCPGWTATDMGGGGRPIPEGAASIVWAVTLPDNGPTGTFTRDGETMPW